MSQPIRAIYRNGQLELSETLPLSEGQEVQVMILSNKERVEAILGGLVATSPPTPTLPNADQLQQEIDEALRGQPPISEDIIQERRIGL